MIYFTYSFNKHKMIESLIDAKLIQGTIISRLHAKGTTEKLISYSESFISKGGKVVLDHPVYMSDFLDLNKDKIKQGVKERRCFNLFLDIQKYIGEYLSNPVREIEDLALTWKEYLKEANKFPDILKVLGVPNFINQDSLDYTNTIINKIPNSKYNFISFSLKIDILSNKKYLDSYIQLIKNIAKEKNISKCMFVIKTSTYDFVLGKINLQKINDIIIDLKTQFEEILMHKNPYISIQVQGLNSLAFGYDKQTNSSSQDVMPFLESDDKFSRSKTACYFSRLAFGNIKLKKCQINAEYGDSYIADINQEFTNKIEKYKELINGRTQYECAFYDSISLQELMNMEQKEKIDGIQRAIKNYAKLNKTKQKEIFNTHPKKYLPMLAK